ncbi:DUF4132 domain-containing protein [Kitasatospora sp. NPDC004240]
MRRFEYTEGSSAKFWEVAVDGSTVTVRYGRIGTAGREQLKELDSPQAALKHLIKVIAEKQGKGYVAVGTEGPAGGPGAPDPVTAAPAPAAPVPVDRAAPAEQAAPAGEPTRPAPAGPVARPDETSFTFPEAWHRLVHPRRGGVRRSVAAPARDAAERIRALLADNATWIDTALGNKRTEAHLAEAARAYLDGAADPVGAAVTTAVVHRWDTDLRPFVDAWVTTHGLPFAACAVVELYDLDFRSEWHGGRQRNPWMRTPPQDSDRFDPVGFRPAADRVRALLAVADDATHHAAVTALAERRTGLRRRIVSAYLAPDRADWVTECCAEGGPNRPATATLRSMLFCSLGSAEQVERLGGQARLGWQGWSAAVVATVAEGIGPAVAPMLAEELSGWLDADTAKVLVNAAAELPSDEAFAILLARIGEKSSRPALVSAMRRYPLRAVRLLAPASTGTDADAALARRLLTGHVEAHHDLVLAALPELDAQVAEVVAPLTERAARVAAVPVETLPALLSSPPWTRRRTAAKGQVVRGLTTPAGTDVVWRPHEREEWSALTPWPLDRGSSENWEQLAASYRQGRLNCYDQARLFVEGPAELLEPLLANWQLEPEYMYEALDTMRRVVARHGVAALRPALFTATAQPSSLAPLLLPFVGLDVARAMADWLRRLKSVRVTARAWFVRHAAAAAELLVPDAVGPAGRVRLDAEEALRLIAASAGAEVVRAAAKAYGPEALAAIDAQLLADPLQAALPTRMPAVGDWADPLLVPQLLLRSGGALPDTAAGHVVTMLAVSKPGAVYPGLGLVTELCTAESASAFAWGLFERWRLAGMPAKDAWALRALGVLGDDEVVRRLTPVIRAWPGESAHQRAVEGLEVLAEIGTDVALLHLHGIAQRVGFKGLKTRAQDKISEVAAGLGLTGEQLADRLVPDFGLDADGSTVVDYGPRRFTVGFDEQLRPYVLDADGKRRKDLPVPGVRDDAVLAPAERKRFAALKKDVRTVAADQVRRLEAAMVGQRSWTAEEFRSLFVAHPLLWHLVRRVVWLAETPVEGTGGEGASGGGTSGGGTAGTEVIAFRVAEDRTFADVEDELFTLADDASVRIAHPLHLGDRLAAWSELFADYEILQPFPQLGRPVLRATEAEAASHRLTRFEGITVPAGRLLGLQRRGWERGEPQDAGVERWFSRPLGRDRHLVIGLGQGIAVGMIDEFPDQELETVWLDTRPCDYWSRNEYTLTFGRLDPVIVSEVLADLTELTTPADGAKA